MTDPPTGNTNIREEDGADLSPENYDTKGVETQPGTIPVIPRWPDMSIISDQELIEIRVALKAISKDMRKKSVAAISKDSAISALYSKSLGLPNSEEEKIFRKALPSSPQAFILDFLANVLSEFDVMCREKAKK